MTTPSRQPPKSLGSKSKEETVNRAPREIAARRHSLRFLDLVEELDLELDEQTMKEAWR
jgi:hypothetical protein